MNNTRENTWQFNGDPEGESLDDPRHARWVQSIWHPTTSQVVSVEGRTEEDARREGTWMLRLLNSIYPDGKITEPSA